MCVQQRPISRSGQAWRVGRLHVMIRKQSLALHAICMIVYAQHIHFILIVAELPKRNQHAKLSRQRAAARQNLHQCLHLALQDHTQQQGPVCSAQDQQAPAWLCVCPANDSWDWVVSASQRQQSAAWMARSKVEQGVNRNDMLPEARSCSCWTKQTEMDHRQVYGFWRHKGALGLQTKAALCKACSRQPEACSCLGRTWWVLHRRDSACLALAAVVSAGPGGTRKCNCKCSGPEYQDLLREALVRCGPPLFCSGKL